MKWCTGCKAKHPTADFGLDRTRPDGLAASCFAARRTLYQRTYVRRGRTSRAGRLLALTRDGDKRQARARVNHLVEVARIPHPNSLPCADCGHVWANGERRHEYDHHRGYGAEVQLCVEPVCTICHKRRDKKVRRR